MEKTLERLIIDYVNKYMDYPEIRTKWKTPLIAFANAKDPLFNKLKEVASPNHILPQDILEEAETVITYFIPFIEAVPISNMNGRYSSVDWARAYIETNKLISDLNNYLIESIDKLGYKSSKLSPSLNMDYHTLMSQWSNRHVGYIAGLGRFGLNNMLITKNGCCGRLGNIVTNIVVTPTKRPEEEYCLYKYNGSCAYCVDRCVNDSLSTESFDRFKCYEMCTENDKIHKELGEEVEVCGKCLSVVPCSFENPV